MSGWLGGHACRCSNTFHAPSITHDPLPPPPLTQPALPHSNHPLHPTHLSKHCLGVWPKGVGNSGHKEAHSVDPGLEQQRGMVATHGQYYKAIHEYDGGN